MTSHREYPFAKHENDDTTTKNCMQDNKKDEATVISPKGRLRPWTNDEWHCFEVRLILLWNCRDYLMRDVKRPRVALLSEDETTLYPRS